MPFRHPPYFLIRGLQHASNLNLRSPLASQDGFGERSVSPDYSPPLWGIMAEDQRLSPHKEFNGPNTLSLQITVESLMQFWPDFDAALYWCGVTPQQSNKVRSQQWLSWSSWKDVLPPVCAGAQGGGWARRKGPQLGAPAACAQAAGGRQDALQTLLFLSPRLGTIIPACSAAEHSGAQSSRHEIRFCQASPLPAGRELQPLGAGPGRAATPGAAFFFGRGLCWEPRGHLRSPSGRARRGGSGLAATGERGKHQPRPRLHPCSLGGEGSAPGAGLGLGGLGRHCICRDIQGYFLYVCITYVFLSKQTTGLGAL